MRTLHNAILLGARQVMEDFHVAMPGEIVTYDWETGKAQIQPLVRFKGAGGAYQPYRPVIGVPVAQWGGGRASLSLPLQPGDTGLLVFADSAIEQWLSEGANQAPPDPRTHDLTDAVFLPGLQSFKAGGLAEAEDAAVLKNGTAKVRLQGGKVALGSDKAELLDLVDQILNLLITGTVPTMLGPQQLTTVTSGQMLAIQNKLALIRGTL